MATVSATLAEYILDAMGDASDGLIKAKLYDDNNVQVGSTLDVAWGKAINFSMSMSTANLVFSVDAGDVVSYVVLELYGTDGELVTSSSVEYAAAGTQVDIGAVSETITGSSSSAEVEAVLQTYNESEYNEFIEGTMTDTVIKITDQNLTVTYWKPSYTTALTPGITHTFEQQYSYTNAGTFTITDITLSVNGSA